jgi:methyl-accepting chemotaxis protein
MFGAGASAQDRLASMVRWALAVFGLLAAAYVAQTAWLSQRIDVQRQLGTFAIAVQEFGSQMLQMRRNEKDFFERKSQAELDKHKASYERALDALRKARENSVLTDDDAKTLTALQRNTDEYRKAFVTAAQDQVALGLDENSGLQGTLRKHVHDAEDAILNQGLKDLEIDLLMLRRHEKDFILREREEYVSRYAKQMAEMSQAIAAAKLDPALRQRITEQLAAYDKAFREFVAGTFAVNKALAAARTAAHEAEAPIADVVSNAGARSSAAASLNTRILTFSAVVLVSILGGLAMLLWSTKKSADRTLADRLQAQEKAEAENESLNNSVISILQAVNQLSQRDLTAKAPVTQDVIGTVSDSINALTSETSKVLLGVTHIANEVQVVSGSVKTKADMVSRTAEEERESVQQMIDALAEATQTMNGMAALAEQSNTSAEQATTATKSALDTVNGTVKGMESIRETIAETEKRIKRLGERSQEITGIVNLINTISERTHVLALNASMQAAVAGEAGRGFAVVAEEVQRLAESSRNATQQIGSLVNNIQLETNETINTVNRTITQVVQGSEQAQKAGDQMRQTQEITAQLVAQVRRIAEGSDRQKEMSAQLLQSVQHIGQSTERTAQHIGAQNKETESLLASARRLVDSVNVFKLPQAA